jgi:shikimate dehydrogenase
MRITAQTRIAGVAGNPVRHSLSPIIHNAWIEATGLDAVYLAFEPPKDRFAEFVDGLRGGVVLGLNVTIPFKEEAAAFSDHASELVRRTGAANLLTFRPDGAVAADNTDGLALIHALERTDWRAGEGPVVLLGAGGAARGAVASLLDAGVKRVRVVNRTPERAEALAELSEGVSAHGWTELPAVLEGATALINSTSLGMTGQPPLEPALETLPQDAVVIDMVYRPLRTALLQAAFERGNRIADGLDMLIGQAGPSFAAIFDLPAPGLEVRGLCERALKESP